MRARLPDDWRYGIVTAKHSVKLTAHFERKLEELEAFLMHAEAPDVFDALLDTLTDAVIPNLETFPEMGRFFTDRPLHSVESTNGMARLTNQLGSLAKAGELREYVMTHYLLLYARLNGTVYLLSIRHHRQLSFGYEALWQG